MAKPYSDDLRARAIVIVEGGASRHEVAALLEVSPSSVINWLRRWNDDGSSAAKPSGGSVSPLEKHANWLLALIAEHPDLTLDEAVTAMRRRRIIGSRGALSRFFIRHDITYKKSLRAAEQARPDVARASFAPATWSHFDWTTFALEQRCDIEQRSFKRKQVDQSSSRSGSSQGTQLKPGYQCSGQLAPNISSQVNFTQGSKYTPANMPGWRIAALEASA